MPRGEQPQYRPLDPRRVGREVEGEHRDGREVEDQGDPTRGDADQSAERVGGELAGLLAGTGHTLAHTLVEWNPRFSLVQALMRAIHSSPFSAILAASCPIAGTMNMRTSNPTE